MKTYLLVLSTIAVTAAIAFELYVAGVVLDICHVIMAG